MKTEKIDSYADLMTLSDFKQAVADGGFIDYDGFGILSDGTVAFPEHEIVPSDVARRSLKLKDPRFTHVVWYNR